MNKIQIDHLNSILEETRTMITEKYAKGAKEHATILSQDYSSEQLLDMALEEAIDQITYLLTLKEALKNGR